MKYLLLMQALKDQPLVTHDTLSRMLDMPPSLVNRYVKRLAAWQAVRPPHNRKGRYEITAKGSRLLKRGSWSFLTFVADVIEGCRAHAGSDLHNVVRERGCKTVALYGATALAETIGRWASAAGLEVMGVFDEERGEGAGRLDDLAGLECDCIVLSDWEKAEDGMLLRLLSEYAPVVNLFAVDGESVPEWS